MTLVAALDGLQTRLETLTGVRVYRRPVEDPADLDALVIIPERIEGPWLGLGAPKPKFLVRVLLIVKATDMVEGMAAIEPYLEASGAQSILGALHGDYTLGGGAEWAVLRDAEIGSTSVGGASYFSVAFNLEVQI